MLSKIVEDGLNRQLEIEAASSQAYLAMASWCEIQAGLDGITQFFYDQAEEERMHMLKLMRFINERGGLGIVPQLDQPNIQFDSLNQVFEAFLKAEIAVSQSINELVDLALKEKDFATHNFLQWYVSEQIEEEALARMLNDKLELIGDDKGGIYLFDRDISAMRDALGKGDASNN